MATTDEIEAALSKSFYSLITSFPDMKDKQVDAIIGALSGNDVFICLPTGYGKTIITAVLPHAFDILRFDGEKHSIVLCICPLISLMMDLRRRLRLMGLTADLLGSIYSRGSTQEDPTAIAAIAAGEVQCVLATPETLFNNPVHRNMLLSKIFVVDHEDFATWLSRTTNFPIKTQ